MRREIGRLRRDDRAARRRGRTGPRRDRARRRAGDARAPHRVPDEDEATVRPVARLPHAPCLHHVRHRRRARGRHDVHGICAVQGLTAPAESVRVADWSCVRALLARGGRSVGCDDGRARRTARLSRVARPARQSARGPRGRHEVPAVPRGRPQSHRGALPDVSQADRRSNRQEHRRPSQREGLRRRATSSTRVSMPSCATSTSRTFNHAAETGFRARRPARARRATNCAACHKTRSFLDARPACSTCHADVHKGALGTDCTRCHSTKVAFKQSRTQFDHTTARFQLTGAHREVACASCHKTSAFRGVEFATCSARATRIRTARSSARRARRATPPRSGTREAWITRRPISRWSVRTRRSPARNATSRPR